MFPSCASASEFGVCMMLCVSVAHVYVGLIKLWSYGGALSFGVVCGVFLSPIVGCS